MLKLFPFFSAYIIFEGHIVLFPVNAVASSGNGSASSAVAFRKGVARARCHFTTNPLISMGLFPSILLLCW